MNNSINYSSFIDLLTSSDDDYEPYGLSAHPDTPGLTSRHTEFQPSQATLYESSMNQWCGE